MHLLRTQPGGFVPDDSIADLGQTPADLVILCSGDSHLALLAETAQQLPDDYPSLRLANPMLVQNHASVDLYVDEVLRHAKVILVSLHGGIGYWRYGVEQLVALAGRGVQLILVPGDDRPDPELTSLSTVPAAQAERLWHYLRQGGKANALNLFQCLASQWLGRDYHWDEPQQLPRTSVYHHNAPGERGQLACPVAARPARDADHLLPLAPAGRQHGVHRCVLRASARRGAQPAADCRGQPQGGSLPGPGRAMAGPGRRGPDHQHHRLCPVQPAAAAFAPVPARHPGAAGHLRTGQPAGLGGQRTGPGGPRPGHAHCPAGTGRAHHQPADQLQGPGLAQRTQPVGRGVLQAAPGTHGFCCGTGPALVRAGAPGQPAKTRGADSGQLPDPRRAHRQRCGAGHPGGGAQHTARHAGPRLPGGAVARQWHGADPGPARRGQQRPRHARPAPLCAEHGAGRLPRRLRPVAQANQQAVRERWASRSRTRCSAAGA